MRIYRWKRSAAMKYWRFAMRAQADGGVGRWYWFPFVEGELSRCNTESRNRV
jgi:hypothetical protein